MPVSTAKTTINIILLLSLLGLACTQKNSNSASTDTPNSPAIGPNGGTIETEEGVQVVFPEGAVDKDVTITVAVKNASEYFSADDVERVIVSCSSSVKEFAKEVELRVPLPSAMTEADSSSVFGGLIDDAEGYVNAEKVNVRIIGGKPYAVIAATHFSNRVIEWIFGKTPPASAGPITTPYYNQGETPYCWASCIQMVTEAAKHDQNTEVTDIIGWMGIDEGGISAITFRMSSKLATIIGERTGYTPERNAWDYINVNQMKDYLKREIGLREHPVALYSGVWEHAVVVVGYDDNSFYLHDPNSTTATAIGYTAKTWNDIAGAISAGQHLVTLVIPAPSLDAGRPEVTANIMTSAFDLVKPAASSTEFERYTFKWNCSRPRGYGFIGLNDSICDTIPSSVKELQQNGSIEIANSSRTALKTVSVWLDISAVGSPKDKGHYSERKELTLDPNSLQSVKFSTVAMSEFRWNGAGPIAYLLSVTALESGNVTDQASIYFYIRPESLWVDTIVPSVGAPGTEVAISGTAFGSDTSRMYVVFDAGNGFEAIATDIVSWTDTLIKVKVPQRAQTGPVLVRTRDLLPVKSNSVTFTVTNGITITGKTLSTYLWGADGAFGEFSATWEFFGSYPDTQTIIDPTYGDAIQVFNVKTQTPARLTATISCELLLESKTVDQEWDSTRYEYRYHDLKTADGFISDPPDPLSNVRVNGTFPFTVDGDNAKCTIDLNLNRGESFPNDNLRFLPGFEYQIDTYTYSLRKSNYGALLSTQLNQKQQMAGYPVSFHIGVNTNWMRWGM